MDWYVEQAFGRYDELLEEARNRRRVAELPCNPSALRRFAADTLVSLGLRLVKAGRQQAMG